MAEFLLAGAFVGAIVGLLHAVHVFGERMSRGPGGTVAAAWFAFWAFALWTIFGAYVLALWLLGLVCMTLLRLMPPRKAGA